MRITFVAILKLFGTLLLIAGFMYSSVQVHNYRDNLTMEHARAEALMVDPTLLKVISGEFKGLMADYLNLKAAIYKGGAERVTDEDWEALYILFKQAMELDPYFFNTGYYTQGILAWREGLHEKAIEILSIQAEHRYWDWEPRFYLGFNYFYYLKDNEKGAYYLQEASKLPNAPPITITLAARLVQRSGQTLTAIAFVKTMLERADDDEIKKMLSNRLMVLLGLYRLELARDAYFKHFGRFPENLQVLFDNGWVSQFPEDLTMDKFVYDSDRGEITFR